MASSGRFAIPDDFDEAKTDAAIRAQYGDDMDELDESDLSEAYVGVATTPSYHPPIVILSAKTPVSAMPASVDGTSATPSSTAGVVRGGREMMSPVATPLFHTPTTGSACASSAGGCASSVNLMLPDPRRRSLSAGSRHQHAGATTTREVDAAGEQMYSDLFRLGALPCKPLSAKQWHAAATEYEMARAKIQKQRQLDNLLAKGADPATCGPAKLELQMQNKLAETRRKREMRVATEMALGAEVWGRLSELGSALNPSHTAQVREAAWRHLTPASPREADAAAQAADQRFAGRVQERRRAIDAAAGRMHQASRAAARALRAVRAAQQAEEEAAASAAAAEGGSDRAAVRGAVSTMMVKAEAAKVLDMQQRMDCAVSRAARHLDETKRQLRMEVRSHLAMILRLQSPATTVNRAGTHAKSVSSAPKPQPLPHRAQPHCAGGATPGKPSAALDAASLDAASAAEGSQVELAPTPWADRAMQEYAAEDAAAGGAAAAAAAGGGAEESAGKLQRVSSAPAAAVPDGVNATPVVLDHSMGTAVVQFAEVFGKLHPDASPDMQRVLRWPEGGGAVGRSHSAAVHRSGASTGSAVGSAGSGRSWGSWLAGGAGGAEAGSRRPADISASRVLSRAPAVIYAPDKTPWPPGSFADDEPLFENPPPPETLGFAVAVQDIRTMAYVLAQALEERFIDIVPKLPSPQEPLPDASRPATDEEVYAIQMERSELAREAQEWRSFLFEAALDAVSVHCYEKMLSLCMDRWNSRDTDLMG